MSYAVQRLPQWFQILATARSDDANDQDLRWYWPPEGRYLRRTRRRCSRRPTRGLLSFRVQAYEEDQARVLTPRQKRTRSWNILRECARFRRTSSTSKLLDLPAEVRTMIWRYAAGGRHLAIFRDNRRLTHCLLDGDNSKRPGELFSISPLAIPIATRNICGNFYKPPQPPKSRILALMRTCRTVHKESIGFLYSENVFILLQNYTLIDLHSTLLPDHFAAIRAFHIHWQVRAPFTTCVGTCYEMRHQAFDRALRPLNARQPVQHLSIFVQGVLHGSASYGNILEILKHYQSMTSATFTVRLPQPTRDYEGREVYQKIYDSGINIVQPPWQAHRKTADEDTGCDVGWRVGTLFSPPMNGALEPETTSYAIFAPIPKQCLRQPRKERRCR